MLVAAVAGIVLAVAASPAPTTSPDAAASASANPAIADFYTADRSATAAHAEFELRLRDDGRAWLVTAPAGAPQGRFETGTWTATGSEIRVDLDTSAAVEHGAPAAPQPETHALALTAAGCTLTVRATTPDGVLGESGIAFTKRHCP